jgi:integrase
MRDYRIGRLNGRFVVTWQGDDGKRRRFRLAAETARTADAEARDVIRAATLPRGKLTIADVWQAYRDDLGDRPTGKTMAYTGIPVLQHFGQLRPDQVTAEDCRAYTAARRASGKSDGTAWTELGHLRSALVWAADKARLIDRAPHIERPGKPAPKDRFLTRAEIDRLLSAPCEPHVKLAIHLMLATAGRVGAVLDLTWLRVDFERGQINLRADSIGPRKGRAVVPMTPTLRAVLQSAHAAALTEHVVEYGGRRVQSIRRGFMAAVDRAGLADVSPHTLRHTAAVHMAAAGVPMAKISQFLGHSSTAVTERVYARFAPDHLTDAAAVLDFGTRRPVQ